jgi:hypothetical protein
MCMNPHGGITLWYQIVTVAPNCDDLQGNSFHGCNAAFKACCELTNSLMRILADQRFTSMATAPVSAMRVTLGQASHVRSVQVRFLAANQCQLHNLLDLTRTQIPPSIHSPHTFKLVQVQVTVAAAPLQVAPLLR